MHVAIIGAYGSAGVAVAEELAGTTTRLTLIDDGDPAGGLCILRGCMPSKELLSAAGHRFTARHDDRLQGAPTVDVDALVASKDEHVATFAAHRRAALDRLGEQANVELLRETARFVDDETLAVGGREITPDHIVIATGSMPNIPDLPGLESVDYRTSADVLDMTDPPDAGLVMGFGYIGLELVPYLAELGVDLTVVEHDDQPLDEADPAFGDALLELYREAFDVTVLTETHERAVESTDDGGVRLTVEREQSGSEGLVADELFLFTGRRPNLDGLDLESTSIEPGPGWVGPTMQSADLPHVFVAGDANGREPILHIAKEQGQVAATNVRRQARGAELDVYDPLHHHVVFSGLGAYPFARIGHSASSAAAAGLAHHSVTREARDDGVFLVKDAPEGLARLVVGADGRVLGYQGFHRHADVMAKTMQVIVELGLDVRELPDRAYHPTTPELIDGLIRDAVAALAA